MPRRARPRPPARPVHLIDTNIILRFLMGDDPERAGRARILMERVEQGTESIIVTEEVLTETVWTLESFYKVPRAEIADRLMALLSIDGVQALQREALSHALQLFAATGADFVDCLLAARANQRNIPVYTFDETDFKKLPAVWELP